MRGAPRIAIELGVILELEENRAIEGVTIDLGLQGALLAVPSPQEVPPLVRLRFQIQQEIEVLARVVRLSRKGIGVEFLDLEQEQTSLLWSTLSPHWPQDFRDCPYCGEPLASQDGKVCPTCRWPLGFQKDDYLKKLEEKSPRSWEMIGTCPAMLRVFDLIRKVATVDIPIFVTGASGTGKEMVAKAIHRLSLRSKGTFVALNCGAIPRDLLESELFGHEKGAFTGALRTVMGKVEMANHGTLFLDEVGELPLELQVKLLRFLQEFSFERVGGRQKIQVDLQVISATNRDLKELIAAGQFREDLYYRLNGINIELPDLKDRGEDVLIMANLFLKRYAAQIGKKLSGLDKEATQAILNYPWPGNVRELFNQMRRGVVMADGSWVTLEKLGLETAATMGHTPIGLSLKEAKSKFEARLVADVLVKSQGKVQAAARALKISRSVIYHLIQKYDLGEYAQIINS